MGFAARGSGPWVCDYCGGEIANAVDLAIRDAFERRGNVGEIADTAGIARPTVYDILKRLADEHP